MGALVYPPEVMAQAAWRHVRWAHADWRLLARDDAGTVVSTVSGYLRDATLDGQPVRLGGIGSVMTHPAHRRQGLVRASFDRALHLFAEAGCELAMLVCESHNVPVYHALGWEFFWGSTVVRQPHGPVVFHLMHAMTLGITRPAPTGGLLDLCGEPW
ncbi:MAG TPA: GNAT family N-acetyltransferase [bacterium]